MFSLDSSFARSKTASSGYRMLRIGVAFFMVSSGLLMLTHNAPYYQSLVFGLFLLTNIANIIAAFFVFSSVMNMTRTKWFRFGVGFLSVVVFLFAFLSTLDFLSFATKAFFPLPHFINTAVINWGVSHYGQHISELGVIALTYAYLLPLQAVAYLLLLVMIGILFFVEKRKKHRLELPPKLILSLFIFLVMAVCAVGDALYIFRAISG